MHIFLIRHGESEASAGEKLYKKNAGPSCPADGKRKTPVCGKRNVALGILPRARDRSLSCAHMAQSVFTHATDERGVQ